MEHDLSEFLQVIYVAWGVVVLMVGIWFLWALFSDRGFGLFDRPINWLMDVWIKYGDWKK